MPRKGPNPSLGGWLVNACSTYQKFFQIWNHQKLKRVSKTNTCFKITACIYLQSSLGVNIHSPGFKDGSCFKRKTKEKTTHGFSFQILLYCNSFRDSWKSLPIKMIIHQEILTFARVRPILTALGGGTSVNPGFLGSCNTFCYPRQLAHGLGELGHQEKRSKSSNLNILWYRYLILTCRSCRVPKSWEMMTKGATFNWIAWPFHKNDVLPSKGTAR